MNRVQNERQILKIFLESSETINYRVRIDNNSAKTNRWAEAIRADKDSYRMRLGPKSSLILCL